MSIPVAIVALFLIMEIPFCILEKGLRMAEMRLPFTRTLTLASIGIRSDLAVCLSFQSGVSGNAQPDRRVTLRIIG